MSFVTDTWVHRLLSKIGGFLPPRVGAPTLGLVSHLYTQRMQRHIVWRLVREHQIDVVHEPTPVSAKFPSLMFGLGAPVAMGPLNTAVKFPPAFRRSRQNPTIDILIAIGYWKFINKRSTLAEALGSPALKQQLSG
ncbi:hypothetical protein [Microcoleus sp. herbarium14]|uniref:hypothetical protein n=1 Tax=Microcoleus sp. herbarium14 TaxID=3055439 RepID=UPI002FD167A6